MNELDVYYRALLNLRAETTADRDCTRFRKVVAGADADKDKIEIVRNICTIDEDWIQEIEKGLVFIEKAIKEERQFIYSQGEVEPIEKVKHVSKDSVVHLAKHSNLITKEQEGDDIIPDQLYHVEKLNDYTVYENRFLYMLLCYLRDFVTLRYNKILDLTNKYDGTLSMEKQIALGNRTVDYSVQMHDVVKDDRYLRQNNSARDIIDRIDLIHKTVLAFLSTPLMEFAAKAAKLKPPITKTNVLKMDNNFKGAVALYDYIIAYDKPGYTVEPQIINISPFGDVLADEMSEAGAMMAFLTYEYGLGLNAQLKESYEAEERRRRDAYVQERNEQIAILKRRLERAEISPEEYIFDLEKHLKLLQNDNRQIIPLRKRVEELEAIEAELRDRVASLESECAELKAAIEEMIARHAAELEQMRTEYEDRINALIESHNAALEAMRAAHQAEIDELNAAHAAAIEELNAAHVAAIEELNAVHAAQLEALEAEHEASLEALRADYDEQIRLMEEKHLESVAALEERMLATEQRCQERIEGMAARMDAEREQSEEARTELEGKLEESRREFAELSAEHVRLGEEKTLCEARIKALRVQLGQLKDTDEFTDKTGFDTLEVEFAAFEKFYRECWKDTKKRIRKTELNYKKLKEQSGQDKEP